MAPVLLAGGCAHTEVRNMSHCHPLILFYLFPTTASLFLTPFLFGGSPSHYLSQMVYAISSPATAPPPPPPSVVVVAAAPIVLPVAAGGIGLYGLLLPRHPHGFGALGTPRSSLEGHLRLHHALVRCHEEHSYTEMYNVSLEVDVSVDLLPLPRFRKGRKSASWLPERDES
uniref:Uncharacterized protein n=1 Tax=Oryza meridionalis TaxID=40149 RepID=A0A0E0D013_9ORYZ